MKKKNKSYGYPYDYSNLKPLHKFVHPVLEKTMLFYKDGLNYVMLEKEGQHQQRVSLSDIMFNKMLGVLDKNGWNEVKV